MTSKICADPKCRHDKDWHKWFVQIGKHPKQFYYSDCRDCPCKKFEEESIEEYAEAQNEKHKYLAEHPEAAVFMKGSEKPKNHSPQTGDSTPSSSRASGGATVRLGGSAVSKSEGTFNLSSKFTNRIYRIKVEKSKLRRKSSGTGQYRRNVTIREIEEIKEDVKTFIQKLEDEIRQMSLINISNPTDEVWKKIKELAGEELSK